MICDRKCPKCGSPELLIQTWSWAIYKNGVFQCFEPGEYVEILDDAGAICLKCNAEFSEEATHNVR